MLSVFHLKIFIKNIAFGAINKIRRAKFRLFEPPLLRHGTSHFLGPPNKYNVTKARPPHL